MDSAEIGLLILSTKPFPSAVVSLKMLQETFVQSVFVMLAALLGFAAGRGTSNRTVTFRKN